MAWRIGLLMPSANTVMEGDLFRGLPHDASLHVARMYLRDTTARSEEHMLDRFALPAAMALKTVAPDLVVFDGSGAPLVGRNYEGELSDQISGLTGAPVLGVRAATLDALRMTHSERLAVVTPYGDSVNCRLKAWFEREGFDVVAMHGMGLSYTESATVSSHAVYAFIQSSVGPRVRGGALFIAGTNVQAMRALSLLEMTYDVPVITSNLAVLGGIRRRLTELREREMTLALQPSS